MTTTYVIQVIENLPTWTFCWNNISQPSHPMSRVIGRMFHFPDEKLTLNYFDRNDCHVCDWSNGKYTAMDSILISHLSSEPSLVSIAKHDVRFSSCTVGTSNNSDKNIKHNICVSSNRKSTKMEYVLIEHPASQMSHVSSNKEDVQILRVEKLAITIVLTKITTMYVIQGMENLPRWTFC
jgi:hypothetical protein